jgi:hypothetical protein
MQRAEFASLICGLLAPWDREPTRDALGSYHAALADLTDSVMVDAVRKVARERLREQAQPTPADIIAAANSLLREAPHTRGADDEPASPEVAGSFARIAAETAFVKRWRPATQVERDGCAAFSELLHQAHGAPHGRMGEIIKRPMITRYHHAGLEAIGGFQALPRLGAHEVILAREAFVRAWVAAACETKP